VDLAAPDARARLRTIGKGASVEEGVLRIDGRTHHDTAVFFSEPEAVPSAVSFEFFIEETGEGAHGFGVMVPSRSSEEYLSPPLDRHRQAILVRSDRAERWNEIARKGGLEYQPGSWHRARLGLRERKAVVEIDGREVLGRDGVEAGPGRFGFYASDGRVRIRAVVLEGAPAKLDPPWREVPAAHVVVCADGGAGGYEAFPDVCLRRSGEMLCVFYAGFAHVSLAGYAPGGKLPPECPRNGRVCLVRSGDLGRTWSRPEVVVDSELDDRDPSIVELADGTLLVSYFSLEAGAGGQGYRFVSSALVRSADGGKTWSGPRKLFPDWAVSSPARVLSDGRLALALYYVGDEKSAGKGYGGVSFSGDRGESWSPPVPVGKEGPLALDAEPDLVELPGGKLLMALRPTMAWSASDDRGRNWSAPARIGFEAHCPYFLRLRSGVLLLAHRLPGTSLHASLDDGRTWGPNVVIDRVGGAYPSLCELPAPHPAGTVFAVYYEEGAGSDIRGRWLRATREGVQLIERP